MAIDQITLGRDLKSAEERVDQREVTLSAATLLRHMVCLGSSGSGKTVASKVICEEFASRGIPVIAIDPQGDIASLVMPGDPKDLEKRGVSPVLLEDYTNNVEVVIYTPSSDAGVPICVNPLSQDLSKLNVSQRVRALTSMAQIVTSLLGYKLDSSDGEAVVAMLNHCLEYFSRRGDAPQDLHGLTRELGGMSDELHDQLIELISERQLDDAKRKLARLQVGASKLLFQFGVPLDIDTLLGLNETATPGKTRISVIYLNTLVGQEDKEFFVAAIAERLYSWMLEHPKKEPQALFYIDEVAPFLPPVAKPASKPVLKLLFKQARKYGVSCLMATQNPGDLDYKSLSQFSTWLVGRLLTKQDVKKIQGIVESLAPEHADALLEELPSLQPGVFKLLSPDEYDDPVALKVRWLLTCHETLEEDALSEFVTEELMQRLLGNVAAAAAEEEGETAQAVANESVEESAPEPEEPSEVVEEVAKETALDDDASVVTVLEKSGKAMTSAELAEALATSPDQVKKEIAVREKAGELLKCKVGKANVYYTEAMGLQPELGLMQALPAVQARVSAEQLRSDSSMLETSTFGKALENVTSVELFYRPLYRLQFRETQVRAKRLVFFGGNSEEIDESIYIDAQSGHFVCFSLEDGFSFTQSPSEHYASEIEDLDGYSQFHAKRPVDLTLRKSDFEKHVTITDAAKILEKRYSLKPYNSYMVVVPYYELELQHAKSQEKRKLYVDALSGRSFELPNTGK